MVESFQPKKKKKNSKFKGSSILSICYFLLVFWAYFTRANLKSAGHLGKSFIYLFFIIILYGDGFK